MLDPIFIIKAVGLIGVFLIVFAETGLFFGFFLPGDSLLFTAGIFASYGFLNIYVLLIGSIIMAFLGDGVGYWTGKKYGRKLFRKEENFFLKKKYLEKTELFYNKHGRYTIIIARFVPVIRTFAPIVAGIGKMRYRSFYLYNLLGGILWVSVMLLLGFFLGTLIPNISKYIGEIIFFIIFLSFLPIFFNLLKYKLKK